MWRIRESVENFLSKMVCKFFHSSISHRTLRHSKGKREASFYELKHLYVVLLNLRLRNGILIITQTKN